MAEKQNKGLVIGIAVAVVAVIAIIVGIVLAKGNGGGTSDGGDESGTSQVESNVNEADYSVIDVSVEYGDYDTMYTLSKSIQNGEATGQIVRIDGVVSHPMSKYSIVQEDESGAKIGTEFVIEGIEEADYPEDGDHVIITGEVIEKEPLYYIIRTTPEYVEILEELEVEDVEEEEL